MLEFEPSDLENLDPKADLRRVAHYTALDALYRTQYLALLKAQDELDLLRTDLEDIEYAKNQARKLICLPDEKDLEHQAELAQIDAELS